MGEGATGGDGTYLATPPPLPAAAAEPAAPGTIFRHRLVVGGGYQPPIGHRQPTKPPVSQVPVAAPNSGREGRGRGGGGTLSGPSALGRGPGVRGPRPVRAEGPERLGDPKAAPRARQGRGHRRGWVCYCRLRPFLRGACRETVGGGRGAPGCPAGAETRAQVRKSAGTREGGGATPPIVVVCWSVTWLSSGDPRRTLGRPVAVRAVVRARMAPR